MKNDEKTAIIAKLIYDAYIALPPGYQMVSIERTEGNILDLLDFNWIEYIIKNLVRQNLIEYGGMGINPGKSTNYSVVVMPTFLAWYKEYYENNKSVFNKIKSSYKTNAGINLANINNANKYHFEYSTNILQVGNKQTKFKKDTRKLLLLKLLLKKPSGIYYDEVVDELEGVVTNVATKTKNIYYEAFRGIEISLGKIGVADFLIFDFNQAKINSIYKRASK